MAAAAALNVVKQIHALAEGPPTPEMRECLGQVVSSLLFFLDHPDSRVRTNAARTLVKLACGYHEEVHRQDMTRARTTLARCEQANTDGTGDADNEELRRLLTELLSPATAAADISGDRTSDAQPSAEQADASRSVEGAEPAAATSSSATAGGVSGEAARGEVVLKVGESTDGKVKAMILEKVVVLQGVVSVTFEGVFVIVSTKTPTIAADASFLADLLTAVKAQGLEGVSLVSASSKGGGSAAVGAAGDSNSALAATGTTAPNGYAAADAPVAAATGVGGAIAMNADDDLDDDEAEPAYLDDEEDEVPEGGGASNIGGVPGPLGVGGGTQWSFFSQNNWMTGRRLQEFGDDPTIAARLAKAKKREEEKRQEEKSKIGMLSSWLSGW